MAPSGTRRSPAAASPSPPSDPAGRALRVETIASVDALQRIRPEWQALWQADPDADVFRSWEWFDNWWRHFGHGERRAALVAVCADEWVPIPGADWRMRVLVVREPEGVPIALLPLVSVEGSFRETRGRIVSTPVNSHSLRAGPIATRFDSAVCEALCEALCDDPDWDLLLLDGMPADCARARLLAGSLSGRGLVASSSASWENVWLSAEGRWSAYLASRARAFRMHLWQNERALAKLGALRLDCHADPLAIGTGFEAFLEVERGSWKARSGESIATVEDLRRRYAELVECLAQRGQVEIWILCVGDRPAAGLICLVDRHARYFYKLSYAEAYGGSSRLSPSQVLLGKVIERTWESGTPGYDFLGKLPFVSRWRSAERVFGHRLLQRARGTRIRDRVGRALQGLLAGARPRRPA
jgi:CelD/BcsL family acetyltransferase involved in cellulose biosynthesis